MDGEPATCLESPLHLDIDRGSVPQTRPMQRPRFALDLICPDLVLPRLPWAHQRDSYCRRGHRLNWLGFLTKTLILPVSFGVSIQPITLQCTTKSHSHGNQTTCKSGSDLAELIPSEIWTCTSFGGEEKN